MSNLTKSIASVCHQLIQKPTNTKVKTNKEYHKMLDEAMSNLGASQEIVLDDSSQSFYVHVKNNVCINLYKDLSLSPGFNDINKEVYEKLHINNQVVQNGTWNYIAMQEGDIEIKFNDTNLSKQISENNFMQKNGVILKGDDCFIERSSPNDRYSLIQSTQEDLKEILITLTGLL